MLVDFCYLFFYLYSMISMRCLAQKVPNLYVFGDSIVESGPKTRHDSGMKAGYVPYGQECMWIGTFRFTNGMTIPDIIAASFNLVRPVSFDQAEAEQESGVNYASASAGILPETGSAFGNNYCMEKQISLFKETVEGFLRPRFQSTDILLDYLSSSIFLINIGSSDYIHNYLQPENYNSSRQYSGEDFAELLTKKLQNHLKDLYNLGARKMVIFQIGPLGCLPYIINRVKPRSRCANDINKLVSIFNDKLNVKLKELIGKLEGSTFVIARTFDLIKSMIKNPSDYGFKDTRWPCCPTQENGTGLCEATKFRELSPAEMAQKKPDPWEHIYVDRYIRCEDFYPSMRTTAGIGKPREDLCKDRKIYLFWDGLHLTEAAYQIIVNKCLTTSGGICSPSNILPYLVQQNNYGRNRDSIFSHFLYNGK